MVVRGVILDAAVVLGIGDCSSFPGDVHTLLRRLRFSNINTAISYGTDLSPEKVSFLKKMADQYSYDCLALSWSASGSESSIVDYVPQTWTQMPGTLLYICPNKHPSPKFSCHCLQLNSQQAPQLPDMDCIYFDKLQEIPLAICHINKKALGRDVVAVGYIMKPSREEDFAKRGALRMCPTPNGLMFFPISFELPLQSQLEQVDVVLHKATDEIVSVEISSSTESANRITYTSGMQEVQRYLDYHQHCVTVDPLSNTFPVMDRLKIQEILNGMDNRNSEGSCRVRGPCFFKVNNFDESMEQRLSEAKLSLPCIVKPQVACGLADAHSMAIVFKVEEFKDVSVPLPALVQEYVNHSSTIFKFYVLGKEVFYAKKKSTPNADILFKLTERTGFRPLLFDSLKSLPTSNESEQHDNQDINMDIGLVKDAASWLSRTLDLTIFGFDVVVQEGSGDHVIVDVNYLPSFKEVPDNVAIPAFWSAIKNKFSSKSMGQ